MKGLVLFAVIALVIIAGARLALAGLANNMVDSAVEAALKADPEESLKQLDQVERWFSWTEAAARIPAERKKIERRLEEKRNLEGAQQWNRELDERAAKEREEEERRQRLEEELRAAAARDRPGG